MHYPIPLSVYSALSYSVSIAAQVGLCGDVLKGEEREIDERIPRTSARGQEGRYGMAFVVCSVTRAHGTVWTPTALPSTSS
mmetsp:Transcript_74991/g.132452  ORF Transcript_74991/g.132452 Transcript_74991/m.132452 type:complete len:81 (+) Transcript_74991:1184-1426(+)